MRFSALPSLQGWSITKAIPQTGHILIVDDEPVIARLHARAVEACGVESRIASNGDEALAMVHKAAPLLMLTDLNMAGLDGMALAAELVRLQIKRFPIVLITADDHLSVVQRGLEAGIDDFFLKGMRFANLTALITHWLASPFTGQPYHIRARALATLARISPIGPAITRLRAPTTVLRERAEATLKDLLMGCKPDFGSTMVDRMRFLGALDGTLATLSRSNALAQLRSAAVMVEIINALGLAWQREALQALGTLDTLATEATFIHAHETLVLSIEGGER